MTKFKRGVPATIIYLVNVDYFFISHRITLAREAKKRGYNVWVYAQDTGVLHELKNEGFNVKNIPVGRGKGNILNDLKVFVLLCYYYLVIKPAVVHHITAKPIIFGTIAAGLFSRKSVVINAVTGLGYAFIGEGRTLTRKVTLGMLRLASKCRPIRTKFIFQNEDDQKLYLTQGITEIENTFIISGAGVDELDFKSKKPKDNLTGPIIITFLARMLKDKGVQEFINAAISLQNLLIGKALFRLVGGIDAGNPAAISEEVIKAQLIDDYLIWEGHRNDVKEVYERTHIACLPSYREGMPKSLIEAMSMSCAIITTDAPGCRACVDEGVNGYLVPVGDSEVLAKRILELVNNKERCLQMGAASREKMMKSMSLSTVVNQTFTLYEA